jgi:hypothetical protein
MRSLLVRTGVRRTIRHFVGNVGCGFGDEFGARQRRGDRDHYGKLVLPSAVAFDRAINPDAPAPDWFHFPYVRTEKFRHCRRFRGHSNSHSLPAATSQPSIVGLGTQPLFAVPLPERNTTYAPIAEVSRPPVGMSHNMQLASEPALDRAVS